MNKKCKVVMLPTDQKRQKGQLFMVMPEKRLFYLTSDSYKPRDQRCHLYIVSDDEIKEDDWFIDNNYFSSDRIRYLVDSRTNELGGIYIHFNGCQKIIATTDSFVTGYDDDGQPMDKFGNIAKQFPSIPQSFIDKYVSEFNKGYQINEVMVEYHADNTVWDNLDNTINIKPIKDSWNREEVDTLIHRGIDAFYVTTRNRTSFTFDIKAWIDKNL
jgi:hypothetical protein